MFYDKCTHREPRLTLQLQERFHPLQLERNRPGGEDRDLSRLTTTTWRHDQFLEPASHARAYLVHGPLREKNHHDRLGKYGTVHLQEKQHGLHII